MLVWLLLSSFVFYAHWTAYFLILLVGSISINYVLCQRIREFDDTMAAIAGRVGVTYKSYAFDDSWTDQDFYDASHFNHLGAKRFAEHVVRDLFLGK